MQSLGIERFIDPKTVVSHFHIREGESVADFGAGAGFYTELLARAVGHSGRLYVCEIQKELVEKVGLLARTKGLSSVHPLWCDLEEVGGVKIPDGTLDSVVMINTLFQGGDRRVVLSEVARTLKSGGKYLLIDWSDSFGGLGPQPADVLQELDARALVESFGFIYERSFDAGDHHYGLAFRKV